MTTLSFSNGVTIDAAQILRVTSNQQTIEFPRDAGELEHLLQGRPSMLMIHLNDGSAVEIKGGNLRLNIEMSRTDARE